jgi:hypothetical protein
LDVDGTLNVDGATTLVGDVTINSPSTLTLLNTAGKISLGAASSTTSINRQVSTVSPATSGDLVLRVPTSGKAWLVANDTIATAPVAANEIVTQAALTTALSPYATTASLGTYMAIAGNLTTGSTNQVLGTGASATGSFIVKTANTDRLTINAAGTTSIANGLSLTGNAAITGNINVSGTSTLTGNVALTNNLAVGGTTTLTGSASIPQLNTITRNLSTAFTETVTITDFAQGETRYYNYRLAAPSSSFVNFTFSIVQGSSTTTCFLIRINGVMLSTGSFGSPSSTLDWQSGSTHQADKIQYALSNQCLMVQDAFSYIVDKALTVVNSGTFTASPLTLRTTFDNGNYRKWMRVEVTRIY